MGQECFVFLELKVEDALLQILIHKYIAMALAILLILIIGGPLSAHVI